MQNNIRLLGRQKSLLVILSAITFTSLVSSLGLFPSNQPLVKNEVLAVYPSLADWQWASSSHTPANTVLEIADFDGKPGNELLTSMHSWPFEEHPPGGLVLFEADMTTVICFFDFTHKVLDAHYAQTDNDLALEITVVTYSGLIQFDGNSCQITDVIEFPELVDDAALGDVNNDGVADVVWSLNNNLHSAPWNDIDQPMVRLGFGGEGIIVDKLNRSDGDDIGLVNDSITILKGNDLSTITEIFSPITDIFEFGDVNGDGSAELIHAKQWNQGITAINVETGQTVFDVTTDDISNLKVVDVNNDGIDEVLVGEANWGEIHIFNGLGDVIKVIQNPPRESAMLNAADIDSDGQTEIIWGYGGLFSAEFESGQIEWQSEIIRSPFQLAQIAESPNNDSALVASYTKYSFGPDEGGAMLLNPHTGVQLGVPITSAGLDLDHVTAVAAANIDADDEAEICLATDGFKTFIICKDLNDNLIWQVEHPSFSRITQMKIIDIDSDDSPELVMVNSTGVVSLYQAENGQNLWHSEDLLSNYTWWGFDGLQYINESLWLSYKAELIELNPVNGEIIQSFDNSSFSHLKPMAGKVYGIEQNVGFGEINLTDMTMDNLIYPMTDPVNLLEISPDEEVAFISKAYNSGLDLPYADPIIISLSNQFTPWEVGKSLLYDVEFHSKDHLFISTPTGISRKNLKPLVDVIFISGFNSDNP